MSAQDPLPDLDQYFRSTASLQKAIELNRLDNKFASKQDAEITYFFDTNVCVSYLDTEQPLQSGELSLRGLFRSSAGKTIDRLSARFLFEGHLPGQNGKSIYLSPPHWNETIRILDRLNRDHKRIVPELKKVERIIENLRKYRNDPVNLLKQADASGVSEILRQLASLATLEKRCRNLWGERDNQRETRIASGNITELWTYSADHIRHQDFKFWQGKIRTTRKAHDAKRASWESSHQKHDPRTIDNDAMTLAAMQAMYRETPESTGVRPTKKFLLITSDRLLMDVVNEQKGRLESEDIPMFLRSPVTYMPFINYDYLHDKIFDNHEVRDNSRKMVSDVKSAVDSALTFVDRLENLSSWSRNQIDFHQNVNRWSAIAELIAIVGAEYFKEDFNPENTDAQELAEFFESTSVISEIGNLLSERIASIRADHTRQITSVAIDQLSHRISKAMESKKYPKRQRRAPLRFIGIDILTSLKAARDPRLLSIDSLGAFLDKLGHKIPGSGEDDFAHVATTSLKSAWDKPQLAAANYLVASAIYFSVGAWNSAKNCADFCIDRLREEGRMKESWMREARYASALALRMTLRSRDEYTQARTLLGDNMAEAHRDLPYFRDKLERAALTFTACVVQKLDAERVELSDSPGEIYFLDNEKIQSEYGYAIEETTEALEIIKNDFMFGNKVQDSLIVSLQGEINLLASFVFDHLLKISKKPPSQSQIRDQIKSLRDALDELKGDITPPFSAEAYIQCATTILEPTPTNLDSFLSILKDIETHHPDRTWADKSEYTYLSEELSRLVQPH